tara:strand:- start:353 stop:1066 length:714 start_codon:yes stop_codon:yes gene_type:complete
MKEPLVSVIIPSYNRFEYLLNAVNSVKNQTYKNYEIIVVNDESSQKEYYEYAIEDINLINIKKKDYPDWGGSRQPLRNIGAEIAKGEYLAFLDDDDMWMNNKLEVQINEMLKNNYLFSSTEGYYGEGVFDKNTSYELYNNEKFYKILKKKYRRSGFLNQGKFPKVWNFDFISIHNSIILSSVIVEKKLFKRLGGFRGLPVRADHDCWLGLLKLTDLLYIDVPLFYYDGFHGKGKNYN